MTPRFTLALLAIAAARPAWAADGPARYLSKPDAWFASDEGKRVADNVLSYQANAGGWARFYEIGTNKPLFADRDGVAKYALADIDYERRSGYA